MRSPGNIPERVVPTIYFGRWKVDPIYDRLGANIEVQQLPDETLTFLRPSRYCEDDLATHQPV
jgi:hypothetical protein